MPVEELDDRECESIEWFGSKVPNGYNMTSGGTGGGGPHSEEAKQKMREAALVPEVVESKRRAVKKSWEDALVRSKRISGMKKACAPQAVREEMSLRTQEQWQDAEIRKKRSEGVAEAYQSDDVKRRHREGLLRALQVPGFLEKRGKAISKGRRAGILRRKLLSAMEGRLLHARVQNDGFERPPGVKGTRIQESGI